MILKHSRSLNILCLLALLLIVLFFVRMPLMGILSEETVVLKSKDLWAGYVEGSKLLSKSPLPPLWRTHFDPGYLDVIRPLYVLIYIFSKVFGSINAITLYPILLLFLGCILWYLYLRRSPLASVGPVPAFLGIIWLLSSPYLLLEIYEGHMGLLSLIVFAPVVLFFLDRTIHSLHLRKEKDIALNGMFFAISLWFTIVQGYITTLIVWLPAIIFYSLLRSVLTLRHSGRKLTFYGLITIGCLIIVALGLSYPHYLGIYRVSAEITGHPYLSPESLKSSMSLYSVSNPLHVLATNPISEHMLKHTFLYSMLTRNEAIALTFARLPFIFLMLLPLTALIRSGHMKHQDSRHQLSTYLCSLLMVVFLLPLALGYSSAFSGTITDTLLGLVPQYSLLHCPHRVLNLILIFETIALAQSINYLQKNLWRSLK